MVRNYIVYGVDAKGTLHEVRRTSSARDAKRVRDAENSPWVRTDVYGSDGPLSTASLDRLADADHHYA